MKTKPLPQVAALSFEIAVDGKAMRLVPAGIFRARDGRPFDAPHWYTDANVAAQVIRRAQEEVDDLVIDYEHQTLYAEQNGQKAPAAGWFKDMEWRDGLGIYAVNVRWTKTAQAHLDDEEYRYLSPVFTYDPQTGEVLRILMAALTNKAGLDGLDDLSRLAVNRFSLTPNHAQEDTVDLKELCKQLGLPETTTEAEVQAALVALKTKATQADGLTQEVAALKANGPDLAKYVPIAALREAQGELATLKAEKQESQVEALVQEGKAACKITPALEPWARDLGKRDLAALRSFLDTAPAMAGLKDGQTDGKAPTDGSHGLSADELAVCKQLGMTPEAFAKEKASQ
ncbi:phage protease [Pseudogulbenkiania ferrooxidans]|uniref:Mu-like prophage I protein n=1 Tax=Pseudogulbenkiania ferrooxidans 2002 TaxID=279714 RepID=B9Z309_9NEIS|nr:phage protease [Pseudogulbenkiania ferrooxidans]EEG08962.1 conserved hypothetical protein [Pseudogulbenkiania ferrooxidans 2002]